MLNKEELQKLTNYLEKELDIDNIVLPKEYFYTCLSLCLIDAVFSIGANYRSTENAVERYCKHYGIPRYKSDNAGKEAQHTITALIHNIESVGPEQFAAGVLENRQRTSSRNGILKSEAVLKCAKIFQEAGIENISDFQNKSESVKCEFKTVKGQGKGVSFEYLCMLCGDENKVKPDRHIIRFLQDRCAIPVTVDNAEGIVQQILNELHSEYNALTLRELDYAIWEYQRSK